jgi:transcription termination factor NusB
MSHREARHSWRDNRDNRGRRDESYRRDDNRSNGRYQREDRREERRDDRRNRDAESSRRSSPSSRRRGSSPPNRRRSRTPDKQKGQPVRNLRIDRHECRKAAIEFLINNYDLDTSDVARLESLLKQYIRSLEMDYEYYAFTIEIIRGLLIDRKYTVITDRWIMGILDEHLQAELRVPDLSILRVAGYELLTHPEIPTTVIVNEVNVLTKMYCPEKQSLLHASINRMIETQISIGNELAMEQGAKAGKKGKHDPSSALIGLDQEAQLAVILLEQRRKRRDRYEDEEEEEEEGIGENKPSKPDVVMEQPKIVELKKPAVSAAVPSAPTPNKPASFTIKIAPLKLEKRVNHEVVTEDTVVPKMKVDASTQTVRDPTIEPGVRIYRLL